MTSETTTQNVVRLRDTEEERALLGQEDVTLRLLRRYLGVRAYAGDWVTVGVQNLTATGVELSLDNSVSHINNYSNFDPVVTNPENVGYVVIEAGNHSLTPDGGGTTALQAFVTDGVVGIGDGETSGFIAQSKLSSVHRPY